MSNKHNKYTVHCGCSVPHAITAEQRQYARRAMTVARSMRDRTAMARIHEALSPCGKTTRGIERQAASDYVSSMLGKLATEG